MSTTNANFDNDPFPVFTPRSSIQQQLAARSPMQPPQSIPHNQLQQQSQHGVNNIIQSPFTSTNRFGNGSNSANQSQQQQLPTPSRQQAQQNLNPNIRSPSAQNTMRSQYQQQSQNPNDSSMVNKQLMASFAQNLNLNNSAPNLTNAPPVFNQKLPQQLNTSSLTQRGQVGGNANYRSKTPSTQAALNQNYMNQNMHQNIPMNQQHHSHAHRKLFPAIDNQNHHMNNEMIMEAGMHQFTPHMGHPSMVSAAQASNQFQPNQIKDNGQGMMSGLNKTDPFFMGTELKTDLMRKNMIGLTEPSQDISAKLPVQVKEYVNLIPLDNQQMNLEHKSRTFSYQTISYKATHLKNNNSYYLKRIMGFRYLNQRCAEIVEAWKKIQHSNICSLRDVFGSKEFNGEHSIVFVYDYYPGLETLQYRLYNNPNINLKGWANPYNIDGQARPFSAGKTINGIRSLGLLPEQQVWDYVIQLASIIRTIHSANLACRIVTPSRFLIDQKSRLHLSGVGIFDVLEQENNANSIAQNQQEDLIEFGRLVLALASNSLIAIQKEHINTSVEIINRNYSTDLKNLISHFMSPSSNLNGRVKSINDVTSMIGDRFYNFIDNTQTRSDLIESDLSKEIENGRLFRLICKLNIVLERQEFNGDIQWSETGDRYMLKLFRDYVFHQITAEGQPWIDLSHIVQCLNKFDIGSSDKICLVSPDGQNIMIVSYAQLKKCFEKVFNELLSSIST